MKPEANAAKEYYKRFGTRAEITINRAAQMFGIYGALVHSFVTRYNLGMPDGYQDAKLCLKRLLRLSDQGLV